jgi:indolepyruvate ferredoxin oxidoreductase alpha subunit
VPIEDIATAFRIPYVQVVGSFQLKRLSTILEEALTRDGPAVVVSRQACALEPSEIGRRIIVARIDQALCDGCMACVDEFGCPAFVPTEDGSGKVDVELVLCNGCAACKFVCPQGAISFVRNEAPRS